MLDVAGVEVGLEVLREEGEEAIEDVDLSVSKCNGWEGLESSMDMKKPYAFFRNKACNRKRPITHTKFRQM